MTYILDRLGDADFLRPARETAWAHVRLQASDDGGLEARVRLLDADGATVARLGGLHMVPLTAAARPDRELDGAFYQVGWQPAPLADEHSTVDAAAAPDAADGWLIVSDGSDVADSLARLAREAGETPVVVSREEAPRDLRQLIPADPDPERRRRWHVVDLRPLAIGPWRPENGPIPADRDDSAIRAASDLLDAVRSLGRSANRRSARLWLVTAGAQPIGDGMLDPLAAMLWGLGRVAAAEHPDIFAGLVDLQGSRAPADAAAWLRREVLAGGGENQVAYRDGQRHVARLKAAPRPTGRPGSLSPAGSYLITGGLGDLGLQVAGRLVEMGARRLILLGRSAVPPRRRWRRVKQDDPLYARLDAVRELERRGACVHLAQVDVGDRRALDAFRADFENEGYPPIRGVVHAAGVQVVGSIQDLDKASLRRDFRPKIAGSWYLHQAFESAELDFFVLFSSAASFLGLPLLGGYAAANAFMDALAHHRRRRGLSALSVNWGIWSQVGMAVRYAAERGKERAFTARGLRGLSPAAGLDALSSLIAADVTQLAVMPIDWHEWRQSYPAVSRAPILSSVLRDLEQVEHGGPGDETALDRRRLEQAPAEQRPQLVSDYLRQRLARVLRIAPRQLPMDRPLTRLGIDSLMATELRNHLEADLDVGLSIVQVLDMRGVTPLVELVLELSEPEVPPEDWEVLTL